MRNFFKIFTLSVAIAASASDSVLDARPRLIDLSEVTDKDPLSLAKRVEVWENQGLAADPNVVVMGTHDAAFVPSIKDFPGPRYIKNELWIRFVIRSDSQQAETLMLESRYALTDFWTLYQKDPSGQLLVTERGDRNPAPTEAYAFRTPSAELKLWPGENVYYLRTETRGPNILALYLWKNEAFKGHRFIDTLVLGSLFGFVIALFFYNSFLAISFRSRTYTYYSLFLFSIILLQASMQNMWPYIVNRELASWLDNEGYVCIGSATNFLALLATMAFLYMKRNLPRGMWVFYALMAFCLQPLLLMPILSFDIQAQLVSVSVGVSSLAMIISSVMAIMQGYRPAMYYLIASMSFLGANILLVLNILGLYHWPHVIQYGNFFGVVAEGLLMSLAIGDRVHFIRSKADKVIRQLNQELQNHLAQVEAQVTERTEAIRTILDNVASGFVIVDRKGHIVGGFSQSCHQLLGQKLAEGQSFVNLLQFPRPTQSLWNLAWNQIFDSTLPTSVSLAQLPSMVRLNNRILHLESKGLMDENAGIKHVLFTIQDVTELKRKQRESRRNRTLIKILQDLEAFRQFINHSFEFVSRLKLTKDKREQAFLLHTLKGNSLVFGLKSVANYLHQLEDSRRLSFDDIQAIERLFLDFLSAHDTILRTPWGNSVQESRVTREQLLVLENLVDKRHDEQLQNEVGMWIREVLTRPVGTLVQPVIDSCRILARRLEKPVRIELVGTEARVRSGQEEKALEFLVHIIRNAIVHGIEGDRLAHGKPKEGLIRIEFKESSHNFLLICSDDGRGFDRQQWQEKARLISGRSAQELELLSWMELVELVSRGGFSTLQDVTMEAGRGVGLEGIIQAVRELGGRIQVESEKGRGSRIQIELLRSSAGILEQAS